MPLPEDSHMPTSAHKAEVGKRIVAGVVDLCICLALAGAPILGLQILAFTYLLVRDGLDWSFMDHRSVGKKLLNLRPIRLDGRPMDIAASAKRNLTLAICPLGALLFAIPFIGWLGGLLIIFGGAVAAVIEVMRIFTDAEGRRLGDEAAGTIVIEESP